MKRLFKFALKFLVISALLGAVGRVLSARLTSGDEASDEFRLATFFGGAERTSTADALLHGDVTICCGGIDLDLRRATLSTDGAHLAINVCMGGIQVTVPKSWRVTVAEDIKAAGIDVQVTPHDDLPDDAPRLEISVTARMGGVAVTTG